VSMCDAAAGIAITGELPDKSRRNGFAERGG
jgi:hypothetical protein